jgi:large subunit ribosomal protein L25
MKKIVLKASLRTKQQSAKTLRREGVLPAVIYGHHFNSTPISLDAHDANLALTGLSASTIVTLDLDGETHAALVREKQKDYIRNELLHVDFLAISMTEKLRARVGLHMEGVSPAVKDFSGVVVSNLNEVEVESLPQYLPEHITVDISALKEIGDAIHVRDLVVAPEVDILADPEEVVVAVSAIREEPEETEETTEETAEPEVIERGKKEENEEEG